MNLNPYESPRQGEPFEEKPMGDSDTVRQLLIEIRDTQREMLELQREATTRQVELIKRQLGMTRFSRLFMVFPLLFMVVPLYFLWQSMSRIRTLPQTPIRAPVLPTPPGKF